MAFEVEGGNAVAQCGTFDVFGENNSPASRCGVCYRYKEKVKGESFDAWLTRIRGSLARQLILESVGLFNESNLFVNGNLC